MQRFIVSAFVLSLAWMTHPALASGDHASHVAAQGAAQAAPLSEGEVKKVDPAAGKITIKHGPLENLGMPAMTMVFRVKEASMLEQVKSGDRIDFRAEKINGALTVTQLEIVKP